MEQSHKILIIEDDTSLLRLYQTKLEKLGYTIAAAQDGQEGLEKVSSFNPDVILLDIIIPKLDGFAVLERLKAMSGTKNIPVILLTNLGQDEDIQKGKSLGAAGYLVKSDFTPAEVGKKIEEALK